MDAPENINAHLQENKSYGRHVLSIVKHLDVAVMQRHENRCNADWMPVLDRSFGSSFVNIFVL